MNENKYSCKKCGKFKECYPVSKDNKVIMLCKKCKKTRNGFNNMFEELFDELLK